MGTSIVEQMEIIETTECRFCRQVIDQRADRCPYCQASHGSAEHQPMICAVITDGTSICEHLVRSLERQGWNFGPAGYWTYRGSDRHRG